MAAFDLETAPEADKISGGANVLGGHLHRIGAGERFVNTHLLLSLLVIWFSRSAD
jgi:hypothetical protein